MGHLGRCDCGSDLAWGVVMVCFAAGAVVGIVLLIGWAVLAVAADADRARGKR